MGYKSQDMTRYFAMTGVAGYIAPRHLQAIKDTGNVLLAATDPHDSVGILDRYFPDTSFFTETERFDRHLEKLRRSKDQHGVDYVTICAPNNLHDAHIRMALRVGAHAICEKPLVLNPWNLDVLQELEQEHEKRVFTLLQLRVHPAIVALKNRFSSEQQEGSARSGSTTAGNEKSTGAGNAVGSAGSAKKRHVDLTYITSRGKWYHYSWKGDISRSGGISTNIGIHFFDMLMWFFGPVQYNELHHSDPERMSGFMELEHATVSWYLSLDRNDLPAHAAADGKPTYRSITIDGEEVEFSGGFTDLHTRVYEETLAGRGFGIDDARESIKLVHDLRNMPVSRSSGMLHPVLRSKNL